MALIHGGDIFAISREHQWDWRDVLDFSASINPLGPSPSVASAIRGAIDRIAHYPEREPARLREALAQTWNVTEDRILLGNGATELIFFLARVLTGAPVTLALPVFSEFHRAFPAAATASLEDATTWPQTGLLVITRPANPTGWTLPLETLRDYLNKSDATVLADESFLEFSGLPSALALAGQNARLIVLRSLTKFYALPGLRLGALIGAPETVRRWREQREPWQVNVLAEEAALAALADTDHALRSREFVRTERGWLRDRLQGLPADANFVCVRLNGSAAKLCGHLLRAKILVRNCTGWPGIEGEAVRIAVRQRHQNERLLEVWRQFPCG